MIKSIALIGPTLDAFGQFEASLGEFDRAVSEYFDRLITGTVTAGVGTIPETNTQGYAVGQVLTLQDSANHEDLTVSAITSGVSLTTLTNPVNSYTVARGGKITVKKYAAPKCAVFMGNPFTATLDFGTQILVAKPLRIAGTIALVLTQGEIVTGSVSGATGRVVGMGANYLNVFPISGTFVNGETLTGTTSTRTLTGAVIFGEIEQTALVTVEEVSDVGPGTLTWAVAVTADVAGMLFTIRADE
ncbi:MAG: hypothetical protein ABSF21_00375 [Dehalococcoidia bacterium]|jgi:hypothetical protein